MAVLQTEQLMLIRGENESIPNRKRVVTKRYVHGGHDDVPVETENKGNGRSNFTAMWPLFFKNAAYCKG